MNYARATRDEPDLRETLYERALNAAPAVASTYADESQSGFRMFNELNDDTVDATANWSVSNAAGGRPTQYKFGELRRSDPRFRVAPDHFIPSPQKDRLSSANNTLSPEERLNNIGTAFRFNEETRPTDAYNETDHASGKHGRYGIRHGRA
jgi:hypothetical protein